jgi:hypothetical protein
MIWRAGMKAVCIASGWRHSSFLRRLSSWLLGPPLNKPIKGRVYTVADVAWVGEELCLLLAELPPVAVYVARGFRPLVEIKTDISIFNRLLSPSPARVKELTEQGD